MPFFMHPFSNNQNRANKRSRCDQTLSAGRKTLSLRETLSLLVTSAAKGLFRRHIPKSVPKWRDSQTNTGCGSKNWNKFELQYLLICDSYRVLSTTKRKFRKFCIRSLSIFILMRSLNLKTKDFKNGTLNLPRFEIFKYFKATLV